MKTFFLAVFLILLIGLVLVFVTALAQQAHSLTAQLTRQGDAFVQSEQPSTGKTEPYSVLGKPSVSASFINHVLAAAQSPAVGTGQSLYNLSLTYGIDDAYALAFFHHESSYGTQGIARQTRSLSNMRCVSRYPCLQVNGGYALFQSWTQGYEAWYRLLVDEYLPRHLVTVAQIIPVYAPSTDNNDETAYIQDVERTVAAFRSGTM